MGNLIAANLIELIFLIITAIALYFVREHLNKRLTPQDKKLLESLARAAVLYVQQTKAGEEADVKLALAVNNLVLLASEAGLEVNIPEMKVIIESQLKLLKKEFGEAWSQP